MVDGLQISPEGLRSHAGHLRQVSDAVGQALDAAGQASISDGCLGMMIGPLITPPLLLVEEIARLAISSSGDTVERLATQVQEVAADFEASETSTTHDFRNTDIPAYTTHDSPTTATPSTPSSTGHGYSAHLAARMGG